MKSDSYQIQKYTGQCFRLNKDFANLKEGEEVYCYAAREGYYFVILPRPWLGVNQIKMLYEDFKKIIVLRGEN